MKRIIYPTQDGIAVIVPAPECELSVEEIAKKDVPPIVEMKEGIVVSSKPRPYKIVDTEAIPSDRTFRGAWEADFSEPDGFGGIA